jgi:hypothetical protein
MDKKERLNQIYEYLRDNKGYVSQKAFGDAIGSSEGTISRAMKGDEAYLTDKLFIRIAAKFSDVFNKDWVIKGEGEMLVTQGVINSTGIIGSKVSSKGDVTINPNQECFIELVKELLRAKDEQLAEKDRQIAELHQIIVNLTSSRV